MAKTKTKKNKIGLGSIVALLLMLLLLSGVCIFFKGGEGGIPYFPSCRYNNLSEGYHNHFGDANMTATKNICLNARGTWWEGYSIVACDFHKTIDVNCSGPYFIESKGVCESMWANWECNATRGYIGCECFFKVNVTTSTTTTTVKPTTTTIDWCENHVEISYIDRLVCEHYDCPDQTKECVWKEQINVDWGNCKCMPKDTTTTTVHT